MSWERITGKIVSAKVDDDLVYIETTDGEWRFVPEGDCCARAYVHEPKDAQRDLLALKGQKIVKVDVSDSPLPANQVRVSGEKFAPFIEDEDRDGDVRDIHFYTVQCEKGFAAITLYVDHNGYYGGSLIGGKV